MDLIIDTNVYSAAARNDARIKNVLRAAARIYFTYVALAELRAGFASGTKGIANEKILQRMLAQKSVSVLYADATTTLFYARIFAELRHNGTPMPTNDLWIAALAMQHGIPLFSLDKHFAKVESITRIG